MVGFSDFIYKHIVPACFLAPLKPTFDLCDAQTVLVRFWIRLGSETSCLFRTSNWIFVPQTLSECALTLKMIHLKQVDPVLWVRTLLWFCWSEPLMCVLVSGLRVPAVPPAGLPAVSTGDSRDRPGEQLFGLQCGETRGGRVQI